MASAMEMHNICFYIQDIRPLGKSVALLGICDLPAITAAGEVPGASKPAAERMLNSHDCRENAYMMSQAYLGS